MKIAFLFLTIGQIYHEQCWLNFFKGNEEKYSVYIHSKKPYPAQSVFKRYEIPAKVRTTWANTMRAQVALLKAALEDPDNSKFVFLSESTIPLQPFDFVYRILTGHPQSQFSFWREGTIYKNSQWVVLNRKHAELMAQDTQVIRRFDRKKCDNEHYPSTFLVMYKHLGHEIVKHDTTLVLGLGGGSPHPHMFHSLRKNDSYNKRLFEVLINGHRLFARKFSPKCDLSPLAAHRPELFGKPQPLAAIPTKQ